jgi:hypothetical protein
MQRSAIEQASWLSGALLLLVGCGGADQNVVNSSTDPSRGGVSAATPSTSITAQPGDTRGHDWHVPGVFAARVHHETDEIERDVVRAVRRGELSPLALSDVRARRAYIEQLLSQYGADGNIQREERRHVDSLVDEMRDAKRHYPIAFGGGPR